MIRLKRTTKLPDRTLGELYIDGVKVCDTLEDTDRGLNCTMTVDEIHRKKVKGKTAIPTGMYYMTLDMVSPKYSGSAFMKEFANGGRVPRLLDVPGYEGVLLHTGNGPQDTEGCILVGEAHKDVLINSKATFKKVYPLLKLQETPIIQIF